MWSLAPHNGWLVLASLMVALMAGFTGFTLTNGLARVSESQRKIAVALAAVALGGGIWSMHFVGMLGLQLPFAFFYDPAVTLASALLAILVVGVALLILHFWHRTTATVLLAGMIVGLGVVAMHLTGMAGLEMCQAEHTVFGLILALFLSCGLNAACFWIAYHQRDRRNLLWGTLCFGVSVFSVHFVALLNTEFIPVASDFAQGPLIGNETMAIGVVLTSFVLCGAFLLSGVTFLQPKPAAAPAQVEEPVSDPPRTPVEAPVGLPQIPYKHEGRTLFCPPASVAAIRADGHYTNLYTEEGQFFCAWSITEAEKRLKAGPFLKTHRSYLVNPAFVSGFERMKDNGVCYFELSALRKVPVSRSRLKAVRDTLGV